MSRFVLSALRSAALRAALPVRGDTRGIRSSADNSGDLYYAVLDTPLRYRGADVHQVILRPAEPGQAPHFGMRGFAVEIAPVVDPAMRTAAVIDPVQLDFAGVGAIDDDSEPAAPPTVDVEDPIGAAGRPNPAPPRPTRTQLPVTARPRSKRPLVIAGAAAAVLAAVAAVLWWSTRTAPPAQTTAASSTSNSPPPTTSIAPTTSTVGTVAPAVKPEAVLRLLPPGYPAGACTADTGVPTGALGALSCRRNVDPGGPAESHFTLFSDTTTLAAQFYQVVTNSTHQDCPNRTMSPGAWQYNAKPDEQVGMLFCGLQDGTPVIAWTDEPKMILAVVNSSPDADQPSMDAMFSWWKSHS
jgi:hypothetical protein